jgi:glycosyltransferase involved in cell wall biosynthesis
MADPVGTPSDQTAACADVQRRRLLVMSYHFPPDGAIGGFRWAGLSKYLARNGWEVHIVTAAVQTGQLPIPGVVVHYCAPTATLNDVYKYCKDRFRKPRRVASATPTRMTTPPNPTTPGTAAVSHAARPGDTPAGAAQAPSGPAPSVARANGVVRLLAGLRVTVAFALWFPDFCRGWVVPATRTTRRLLRQYSFDVVASSGPPHSTHIAAMLSCARRPGLLCIDLRDPLAAWDMRGPVDSLENGNLRSPFPRLERRIFRRADILIANTTAFANVLRRQYPAKRIEYVPNGVDPERLPPPATDRFDGLSIAYAGSLYLNRSLTTTIHGMRAFLESHPEARAAMKLRVAGVIGQEHGVRFRDEVIEAGLGESIEVLGNLSGTEALALINRSHLALVLAQGQEKQVPAKLYECVALGVPTLVIAEPTSAAASEANRVSAMTCSPNDSDTICQVLEGLWAGRIRPAMPKASIGYREIARQMDMILRGDVIGD